jgi:Rrf2 family protein
MKATKKTQYALRAMIVLSKGDKTPISLRFIAKKEGISFDYLEKIFSKLEKNGLIGSKRGATGGYFLVRSADKITLKDIFDATEESISVVDCQEEKCPRDGKCKASRAWKNVNNKIEKAFSSIKLSDL